MNPFEERKKKQERIDKVMSHIKYMIAVGSGKGGVGKSTVAANLAIMLAKKGFKTGLADTDIYGPSIPTLFDIKNEDIMTIEQNGEQYILPVEKYGLKLMSIGFMVESSSPLIWRGPMASNTLTQMLSETYWEDLDFLVLDMPPGTGDIQLTLTQTFHPTGSIFVCTPGQLADADVKRAITMFQTEKLNIPVFGLVENMAYFTPKELPQNKYYIFGKSIGEELSKELNIDFLGQIPIALSVSESNDSGNPIALTEDSIVGKVFEELTDKVIAKSKETKNNK